MATISEKQKKLILEHWLRKQSLTSTLTDVVPIILTYCKIIDAFLRNPHRSVCGAVDIEIRANGLIFDRIYAKRPSVQSVFGSFTAKPGGVYQWKLKIIDWPGKRSALATSMRIGIARDFVAEERLNYKGGGFMDELWYSDGGNYTWEFDHDDCLKGDIISIKLDLDELTMSGTGGSFNIAPDFRDEGFRLGIATRMYRNTDNFKISLEIVSFDILKYP